MQCSEPVPELEVMFFLNVFLCKTCAAAAQEFRSRAKSELEAALAYLDTAMQEGLKDPQVSLKGDLPDDLPRFGVGQLAMNLCVLSQKKAEQCQEQSQSEPTPSTTSTKPLVLGTGAPEHKSSPSQ